MITIIPTVSSHKASKSALCVDFERIYLDGEAEEIIGFDCISAIENLPESFIIEVTDIDCYYDEQSENDCFKEVGKVKVAYFPEAVKLEVKVLGIDKHCFLYAKSTLKTYYLDDGRKVKIPQTTGYVVIKGDSLANAFAKRKIFN